MQRIFILFLLSRFFVIPASGQEIRTIVPGQADTAIRVSRQNSPVLSVLLKKKATYHISVQQRGIDVVVVLKDPGGKVIKEIDSPTGTDGEEVYEYTAADNGAHQLVVKRLDESGNPGEGKIDASVSLIPAATLKERERIRKALEPENRKTVLTADIDHFWEAFDRLPQCKTHADSVQTIQKLYLDRATDGLIDFIRVRQFTAEKFVKAIAARSRFYQSVRPNTLEAKKAVPQIEDIFRRFQQLYPDFRPFKVCFAIGIVGSGGTTSERFVLVGTEVALSSDKVDLSEFRDNTYSKQLMGTEPLQQKIRNIVAHECVHTQQVFRPDTNAVVCRQLYLSLHEGIADFIGELLAQGQLNTYIHSYGDQHEAALWQAFKATLCKNDATDWLYNYNEVKGKPADLGYYMGYRIAQAYYEQAKDKQQAVREIIRLRDPLQFLQESGYDRKMLLRAAAGN